jgi:hypothetical protein
MYSVTSQGVRSSTPESRTRAVKGPLTRCGFALEPCPECGVPGELRVHHLDGDLPAARGDPEVDAAHAAVPEQPDELVAAEALRVARSQRHYQGLGHGRS